MEKWPICAAVQGQSHSERHHDAVYNTVRDARRQRTNCPKVARTCTFKIHARYSDMKNRTVYSIRTTRQRNILQNGGT